MDVGAVLMLVPTNSCDGTGCTDHRLEPVQRASCQFLQQDTELSSYRSIPMLVKYLRKVQEEQEHLLKAVAQPMGFHNDKPLAPLVILRAGLHWGYLHAVRVSYFDHINRVCSTSFSSHPFLLLCISL